MLSKFKSFRPPTHLSGPTPARSNTRSRRSSPHTLPMITHTNRLMYTLYARIWIKASRQWYCSSFLGQVLKWFLSVVEKGWADLNFDRFWLREHGWNVNGNRSLSKCALQLTNNQSMCSRVPAATEAHTIYSPILMFYPLMLFDLDSTSAPATFLMTEPTWCHWNKGPDMANAKYELYLGAPTHSLQGAGLLGTCL